MKTRADSVIANSLYSLETFRLRGDDAAAEACVGNHEANLA